jgi:hypothetical protein
MLKLGWKYIAVVMSSFQFQTSKHEAVCEYIPVGLVVERIIR